MADWPNDKELEEIYRKGSEKHDFTYSSEAWEEMEILLNKDRRRKYFLFFFISLGIILGSFGLLSKYITLDQHKENAPIAIKTKGNSSKNPEGAINYNQQQPISLSKEEEYNIINPDSNQKTLSNTQPTSAKYKQSKNNFSTAQNFSIIKPKKLGKNNSSNFSNTTLNTINNREALNPKLENITINKELPIIEFSSISPLPIHPILYTLNRPANNLEHASLIEDSKFSKFMLSSSLAAESSWTPNGEYSSIDIAIGLHGSYFTSRKFSFSIGASYLDDLYVAEKGDYKSSTEGFWKSLGAPEYVNADCKMIELYTGISYYFKGVNTRGLSAKIGLLSNFMLKESYDYHYTEESNNFSSTWSMSNKTYLNSLELGTGYRFNLNKNWMIEAGPYMKIPLSGIGHGDVMLTSIGLRASIGIISN